MKKILMTGLFALAALASVPATVQAVPNCNVGPAIDGQVPLLDDVDGALASGCSEAYWTLADTLAAAYDQVEDVVADLESAKEGGYVTSRLE